MTKLKTIPKIKKEIKQIEIDCLKSVQCHFPEFKNDDADGREELYNFKLSDNWHHYLEKKAQLKTSQDIYDEINEMLKEEDCSHLEELKARINGEKKK